MPEPSAPPRWEPVVPYDRSFDARYGLEFTHHEAETGEIQGRIEVRPELLTEHGLLHGGILAAAAEAIASTGTALTVMRDGNAAMGLSNDTTVLRDVRDGTLNATARVVSRGEDTWVWTVDTVDGEDRPCAHSRVTVAVRPLRRPS